jgi:hypothetical protein
MSQHTGGNQMATWMADATGRSEAEVAFHQGVAVVGAVLLAVLHAIDVVFEAWPLPNSRVRK